MCEPIDPLVIELKGSVLLNKLVLELHHAWGELTAEPRSSEHLHSALHIIRILNEGGFIKEEGGA